MEKAEIEGVIEAVLFAHAEPISAARLAAILEIPEEDVVSVLESLRSRYLRPESGLGLLRLGERWQLATKNEYAFWIRRALETRRATPLTQAAMETLTVIAYNQPVSRAFIEQVRGVDSSSSVSGLLEKGLIEEAGRLDLPGHPVSFKTTDHFLRTFGLTSLEDLPPIRREDDNTEKEGKE